MKIVLTGGIASGKSAVAEILKRKGYAVIDADLVSRQLTAPRAPLTVQLANAFGSKILTQDGALNRAKLREIAFATVENTALLNSLTHNAIMSEAEKQLASVRGNVVVAVPLYFETGISLPVDEVWTVEAAQATRIKRLMKRDNIEETTARNILERQMTDEERASLADRVIHNNGTPEDLINAVEAALSGR